MSEFKGPIVEGAWYEREDGVFSANSFGELFTLGNGMYYPDGEAFYGCPPLTRRVYITHTDPAEVVAELRAEVADLSRHNQNEYTRDRSDAITRAADLVAEKLGVKS